MTDVELDAFEALAKAATPGPWITVKDDFDEDKNLITTEQRYEASPQIVEIAILETGWNEPMEREQQANLAYIVAANPSVVLDLIAELRQARAERDWIAGHCDGVPCNGASCPYPPSKEMGRCIRTPQRQCWLDAAKEATCPKN